MPGQVLVEYVTQPRRFFSQRNPADLTGETLGVIAGVEILTIASVWLALRVTVPDAPSAWWDLLHSGIIIMTPLTIAGSLILWATLAGVAHYIVRKGDETASYWQTFGIVGLAAILKVLTAAINFVDHVWHFSRISFEDSAVGGEEMIAMSDGSGAFTLVGVLLILLWQTYLWREGFLGVYDIEPTLASVTAVLLLAISLTILLL